LSNSKIKKLNHWRREEKIVVFTPHTVADVKRKKKNKVSHMGTDCAACGSGCSGGGCSGSCLGD